MASINFLEKVISLLVEDKYNEAIDILNKESAKLKRSGKMHAGKRIQNLIKKIPAYPSPFSGASMHSTTKSVHSFNSEERNLVKKYYPTVTIEQVVLNSSVKQKMSSLFREWEDVARLQEYNLFPTNRILFYGPPGTGKTLLANAIAEHLNFPLVLVQLDELMSSFLGETGKNIREIFDIASKEPVVLFLDEIDTIAKFRADDKELGELKRVVTVLLQHIDFFSNKSIVIGATNHDEVLDKAIWRRFPLKVKFDLPDTKSRQLLFKLFLYNHDHAVDLDLMSKITDGLNGSDIFEIVQSAKKEAVLSQKKKISNVSLAKAYLTTTNGDKHFSVISKKTRYSLCQELKNSGIKLRKLEEISGIPYTTLRDNLN